MAIQASADRTVRVLSLSHFCPDFPENRVCCLSAIRILFELFSKIDLLSNSIRDRQRPDRKSRHNPDSRQTSDTIFRKIRTKTRQGQDTDSAVRRRLIRIWKMSFYEILKATRTKTKHQSWIFGRYEGC